MDFRLIAAVVAAFVGMLAVVAAGGLIVHGLIWLLEHQFDPSLPLRTKAEARVNAIEMTLRAIRQGLIRVPRVTRRTVR